VICASPRSGTNFLRELLASTGVLGRPREYFNTAAERLSRADYPADPEAQLAAIPQIGATPNGVYGLVVFPQAFEAAGATRWTERLPRLSFVYLERWDSLGQAISHVRAAQTSQWVSHQSRQGDPRYDQAAINVELVEQVRRDARWRYYFARNGISPLRLVYERLVEDPEAAVAAIARLVALETVPKPDLSCVSVRIQRDALTDAWRARFIAESRDIAKLY